jgi:uncharacterized protein
MSQRNHYIYIAPSELGGRGVFAGRSILANEIIELCPVIVCGPGEFEIFDNTTLYDYYFLWGDEKDKQSAIALGYGSLYNHDSPSNADYEMDFEDDFIKIYAVRDIAAGEEITINYNGSYDNTEKPWFMTDER